MIHNQNQYSNLPAWHSHGFDGSGVVIWNAERSTTSHGSLTTKRILDSAPNATVVNGSLSSIVKNKKLVEVKIITDDNKTYDVEEFIQKFNIKLITRSMGGTKSHEDLWTEFWQPLKEKYNLIFFVAAGNEGTEGRDCGFPPAIAILVGACGFINGKPVRDNYSSIDEEIDFVDFRGDGTMGTSFASPYLCGKAALLVQKYGNHITQDFVYQYFKDHAEDMEEVGGDRKTGWGLPIMGKIETEIIMQIGNHKITVDGKPIVLDQCPVYNERGDRTLVPLRAIAEAFGATVDWDGDTQTITIVM